MDKLVTLANDYVKAIQGCMKRSEFDIAAMYAGKLANTLNDIADILEAKPA